MKILLLTLPLLFSGCDFEAARYQVHSSNIQTLRIDTKTGKTWSLESQVILKKLDELTQQDVLNKIKEKYPAYIGVDDAVLARAMVKTDPKKYEIFANFSPNAKVSPSSIPKEFVLDISAKSVLVWQEVLEPKKP